MCFIINPVISIVCHPSLQFEFSRVLKAQFDLFVRQWWLKVKHNIHLICTFNGHLYGLRSVAIWVEITVQCSISIIIIIVDRDCVLHWTEWHDETRGGIRVIGLWTENLIMNPFVGQGVVAATKEKKCVVIRHSAVAVAWNVCIILVLYCWKGALVVHWKES